MRSMWVIYSKEFLDIIRDRRRFILMLLSTFVFLPLLILGPYAYLILHTAKQSVDVLTIPVQGKDHAPALIRYLEQEHDIRSVEADDIETLVRSKQYSVGLSIPVNYEATLATGGSVQLLVIADKRRTMDVMSTRLMQALKDYNADLLKARLQQGGLADDFLTPLMIKQNNVATSTETAGSILGVLMPGVLISLALSAGMPIAVSSIAGEKQKLTLEPILFTTVSRFQLVFAKLLAVLTSVVLTMISFAVSIAGMGALLLVAILRAVPVKKLSDASDNTTTDTTASNFLTGGYHLEPRAILFFFLAPFLIILLGAALQILISTWARNDEEATTYLGPLNLVAGAVVFVTMFLDDYVPQLWHYALPVFGTILSMRDLLSNKIDSASLSMMFGSSALYAALMVALAVWMFQREEIVFRT